MRRAKSKPVRGGETATVANPMAWRSAVSVLIAALAFAASDLGMGHDRGPGPAAPAATYRGKTAAQWAESLDDKDYGVRWHATYALGRMGPDAAPAVAALERILAHLDEHEYVRGGAAWALGRIGPQAASAVPLLARTLSSKHASVRRNAALALGRIASLRASIREDVAGLVAPHLTPKDISDLTRLLGDEEPAVRVAAAQALWRIERHPKALPTLEAMLRNPNGSIACEAAAALGELAADGAPVAGALAAALGHADEDARRAAAQAIGRAGRAAVPLLQDTLATAEMPTKIQAVEALGWIGPAALPALTEALDHANPLIRRHAARAVGRLGPAAKAVEPALLKAVNDSDVGVRDAAARALRRIRGDQDLGPPP